MKKICLFAASAAAMLASFGAKAEIRQFDYDVAPFSEISVGGDFEVSLQQGTGYHVAVTIESELQNYITCEVKGKTLTIKEGDKNLPKEIKALIKSKELHPVYKAVVSIPSSISGITLEDKAILNCLMPFEANSFKIKMSDNTNLKNATINNANYVEINADRKATAQVLLESNQTEINVSGNSNVAVTQKGKSVDASVSANANLTLYCDAKTINMIAKGTSKTLFKGKADKVEYNMSGSSNVNALELETEEASIKMNSVCSLTESASKMISVELSAGATLIFNNDPVVRIEQIKSSSMRKYDGSK